MALRWLLALVLATLFSTVPAQAQEAKPQAKAHGSKHGNFRRKLLVGSLRRTYVVHVPKGYDKGDGNKPVPLVIVLPGGLGNELSARWDTKMSGKADRDHFFAV